MYRLPVFTALSLAALSLTALASGPGAKTKKHRPQRATYSAVNPFATPDPFTSALKASTSTTANKPAQADPLAPSTSNPYLNLDPKPASSTHSSRSQSKN
ncbi:MAG: hypothetical protein JSS95_09455 [Acidobacteria bacterium]|nr:hypothetical protein [Acidobacteriota bacterium]